MNSIVLNAAYYKEPGDKPTHYHDCHQVLYVCEGEALVNIAGNTYNATKGTIILISRFEEHSIIVKSPEYKRFAVRISPDIAMLGKDNYFLFSVLINRRSGFKHTADLSDIHTEIYRLLSMLKKEKGSSLPLREEQCELLFKQILILLYRHNPELFSFDSSDTADIAEKIQKLLENNYSRKFTLEELAAEYNLSTYYLSHIFKNATGYSPMNYLLYCRIAEAKKCLAKTAMPICEIIEHCGFSDNSNFSRSFKREVGVTPTEFRKQYK